MGKSEMTYEEKCNKFINRNSFELFKYKTTFDELPIKLEYGSSTHNPDEKGGHTTNNCILWIKFLDREWVQPYGRFNTFQIASMIDICSNDNQIISLMELLTVEK